ncbi:MAG: hypothetical protein ACK2T6_05975 [Anaerolineae bacterium]
MARNSRFIPLYDGFKFVVAVVLIFLAVWSNLSDTNLEAVATGTDGDAAEAVAADVAGEAEGGEGLDVDVSLPDIPAELASLQLDVAAGKLLTPNGEALFGLSGDGLSWEPIIPEGIGAGFGALAAGRGNDGAWLLFSADDLPAFKLDVDMAQWLPVVPPDVLAIVGEGVTPTLLPTGQWALVGVDGGPTFELDPAAHQWVRVDVVAEEGAEGAEEAADEGQEAGEGAEAGEEAEGEDVDEAEGEEADEGAEEDVIADLPDLPDVVLGVEGIEVEGDEILTADGIALFRLSDDGTEWELVVPDEVQARLDELHAVLDINGDWVMVDGRGETMFRLDPETGEWIAVVPSDEETEDEEAVDEEVASCVDVAQPARLEPGDDAVTTVYLHFRAGPGLAEEIYETLPAGTPLVVVGGPQCVLEGDGAHLWWNVQKADGAEGWSAEASSTEDGSYYLEPQ